MAQPSQVYDRLSGHDLFRMEQLGIRVRIARQRRNWTQKNLVEKTGVSLSTLKLMEAGSGHVPLAFWVQVLSVFHMANGLDGILLAEDDHVGAALEDKPVRQRIKKRVSTLDNFEFPS